MSRFVANITDQYRTIISRAGWIDRSTRGRLRFEGRDAASFLQALLTNDVTRLQPGDGLYAAYLTPQGRMLADLELYRRADSLVASVAPGQAASLASRFDQLVFAEDVRVTDDSAATIELAIAGEQAPALVGAVFGLDEHTLERLQDLAHLDAGAAFVARSGEAPVPIFKVFAPHGEREAIVEHLQANGVPAMSDDLAEALRVAAGRPRFGVDMTEETIPLEAGLLERAISTTKGCYVGQEVIIRILHRGGGRVVKRLATLSFDVDGPAPDLGARLTHEGRDVGHLTSVAHAPTRGAWIALGYVHRDAAKIGAEVTAGGSIRGRVTGFAG